VTATPRSSTYRKPADLLHRSNPTANNDDSISSYYPVAAALPREAR
jgi:hypothetical protein